MCPLAEREASQRAVLIFTNTNVGQEFNNTYRCLLGVKWNNSEGCGSRGSIFSYVPLLLDLYFGARCFIDDGDSLGHEYNNTYRSIIGGTWSEGVHCGSRGSHLVSAPLSMDAKLGARMI